MKQIIFKIKRKFIRLISEFKITKLILNKVKIKQNRIFVNNYLGKGYGDNPKYIVEELLKTNKDIEIYWLKSANYKLPPEIKKVNIWSLKQLYIIASSKIIIANDRNYLCVEKKKGQYYLQTWHGGYGSKLCEGQVEEKLPELYVKEAKIDGKNCDAIIPDCKFQGELFKKYFWINENCEILKCGLPRNDIFFNERKKKNINNKVRKNLDIKESEVIILYAPTFRDDGSKDGYLLKFNELLTSFENKTKHKCKVIVRFHPNVSKDISNILTYNENIINGSTYPDMQELLIASDYLITDYSSSSFDYMYLKKPVILYVKDEIHYRQIRGLSKDYDDFPFPKAYNEEELNKIISDFQYDKYISRLNEYFKLNEFYNKGDASKQIVNWICKKMKEE